MNSEKIYRKLNRIALGTAQFGLDYGIAGGEKIQSYEVCKILNYARENEINTLDTAISYGDSEQLLGEAGICEWKTVTKLPAIPENCQNLEEWVIKSVYGSLERLRIPKLYGLLLHRPKKLLGASELQLYSALLNCKDRGYVQKIGISIYDPSELEEILDKYPIDLVQAPFNVIDRRLETSISLNGSCWLDRLRESGVEIHVRSIFLQGLLLMKLNQRPEKFSRWNDLWSEWDTWLEDNHISALKACLNFALSYKQINRIVVGVDSLSHLEGILENIEGKFPVTPSSLISNDSNLLNPSCWGDL